MMRWRNRKEFGMSLYKRLSKLHLIGAVKACLLASLMLSGCSTAPTVIKTPVAPPDALLRDCAEPQADPKTNQDLVFWIIDLQHAVRKCNADKQALRVWYSEALKE